jgi:hypothetical protein
MKYIKSILLLTFLPLLTGGCGLLKKTEGQQQMVIEKTTPETIAGKGGIPVFFDYISYNTSLSFISGGNETTLDGQIRIKKDSLIWISVRKFGLEAARMMLSKDSVWVMDRINSRYFAGDYSYFVKQFNLDADYGLAEALMLANPLENWSAESVFEGCTDKICKISYPGRYRINQGQQGRSLPEGSSVTDQRVEFSEETGRLLSNTISVQGQERSIQATYTGWKSIEQQLLPLSTTLRIENRQTITELSMKNEGHSLHDAPSFPFKIPASYKPMM